MPSTYTLISSNVLSSSVASVTFSSIPSTYTDLVLRVSARGNDAAEIEYFDIRFNSDSGTNYSNTRLTGNGASGASVRQSNQTLVRFLHSADNDGATANTYGNTEIYIPSYTVSQNKPVFHHGVQETNSTQAFMAATAGLWRNTAAITSISITPVFATAWLATSSFYLYGIKNS